MRWTERSLSPSELQPVRERRLLPEALWFALRTLVPYAVFGVLWLTLADSIAEALTDPYDFAVFEEYKGWIFVAISLFLVYVLVRGEHVARVRSEQRFVAAFATTPDPMAIIRLDDGSFVEVNEAFTEHLGYSRRELKRSSHLKVGLWIDERVARNFENTLREAGEVKNLTTALRARDGTVRDILLSGRKLKIGRHDYAVLLAKDITEMKRYEAQVTQYALHDPLTGLPNRSLILDRLGLELVRARRGRHRLAALALNLDRFQLINDSFGHGAGDQLLIEVAARITACLRREDSVARSSRSVARLGADEYTIVLGRLANTDDAVLVVGRILETLREPFKLDEQEVSITAGIGIAMSDDARESPEALLRQAEIAMRRAKAKGLGQHHVFTTGDDTLEVRRLRLENDLRHAVERGELELLYQPIVHLETGRVAALESLVRWNHPELGLLSPIEFIPIAEESGQIPTIGRWVIEEACRRGHRWHQVFSDHRRLVMAVNVSAQQLEEPAFHETVSEILRETALNPACLALEITESVLVRAPIALHSLKSLGLRLSIDDFGTGYSSLSYLSRLPVDAVKIDRSFITDFEKNPQANAVVHGVLAIAKSLKLGVTAEGIDTAAKLGRLRELGCPYGQGYFFAKPLRREKVEVLLKENPRW